MKFEPLIDSLKDSIKLPLPGEKAQYRMAPTGRAERVKQEKNPNARQSAVLILIHPDGEIANFTVIKRTADGSPHSGQISLPGGALEEEDSSLADAALRETWEEIGVPIEEMTLLGGMSSLYIPVSNFEVHPFIAYTATLPEFKPDPKEVHSVHSINPIQLNDPSILKSKEFPTYIEGYKIKAPYYHIGDLEIWGATSMILSEFSDLIK